MRPFIFISTNLHGAPAMRRAALWALTGVLIMGVGGLAGGVLFIIAVLRVLTGGFAGGGRALLLALVAAFGSQLLGALLLRLGGLMLRRAATGAQAPGARGRGVTIEGEFVEREPAGQPRLDGDRMPRDQR